LWCTGQHAHLECGRCWVLWCTSQHAHLESIVTTRPFSLPCK
jgi:hypothetical protein